MTIYIGKDKSFVSFVFKHFTSCGTKEDTPIVPAISANISNRFICGGREIRTPVRLSPPSAFQARALGQLCDPTKL